MSDVSQGPGWWLASDGKWVFARAALLTTYLPPPPPPPQTVPQTPTATSEPIWATGPPTESLPPTPDLPSAGPIEPGPGGRSPLYKRKWTWADTTAAVAFVVVLIVALSAGVHGKNASPPNTGNTGTSPNTGNTGTQQNTPAEQTLHLQLGLLNGTTGETNANGDPELIQGEPYMLGTDGDADIASGTDVTVKDGSGSLYRERSLSVTGARAVGSAPSMFQSRCLK